MTSLELESWEQGDITGMRGLAHRLGLHFCGDVGDRGYRDEVGGVTQIGILGGIEPRQQISDLMYGRYRERNLEVFNVDLGSYPDDPGHSRRSCVLVTFAADFPRVSVGPHSPMTRLSLVRNRGWLSFAPEPFRQRFNVDAADDAAARAVLSDDLMAWLMGGRDDVRLTIDGGGLLGHVPHLGEEDERWQPFVDYVLDLHGQIPAEAWSAFGLFGSPG